jgi:hypothetical protein
MLYQVLSLIVAVFVLVCAVWQPIRTRRVRDGWKPERFKGTHQEFVAKYRGQLKPWFNLVFGGVLAASGLLGMLHSGQWWRCLVGVALLILGGVCLWCRRILDSSPRTRAGTSEGQAV